MEYILHIGLPKTGSTSLQKALWNNRGFLRQNGVIYPGTLSEVRPKHKGLLVDLVAGRLSIKDWERMIFEESGVGADVCVLSNENFSFMEKPELFASLIRPDRIRVVMYIREPVAYIASRYRHNLLAGNMTMRFWDFAKSYRLPYLSVAERWGRFIGRKRVEIRRNDYSDAKWNIVSDFF